MSKINPEKQIAQRGATTGQALVWNGSGWVPGSVSTSTSSTRVYRSTSLTLADSTWVVIGFNNEVRDELSAHDNATNNSRVTVGTTGRYRITGCAGATSATQMALRVTKNGDPASTGTRLAVVLTAPATASEIVAQVTTGTLDLTSGDYIELWIIAFKAGGTTLDSPGADSAWFEVERVA